MSEHTPRIEPCENTPRKQYKNLTTSISSKHRAVLGSGVCAPPRSIEVCLVQLLLFISLYRNTYICHVQPVLMTVHFTQVILLNPQSTNCPMLGIKSAIVLNFIFRPCTPRFTPPIGAVNKRYVTSVSVEGH